MKKEFIPYEQALELKNLGFDEPCFGVYYDDGELHIKRVDIQTHIDRYCLAPIFSQAFRWFREKRGLDSWIVATNDIEPSYSYIIMGYDDEYFATYEEVQLDCLCKLIESIKTNNMEQNKIQIFDGKHVVATKYQE
jgi:hypothetical protein